MFRNKDKVVCWKCGKVVQDLSSFSIRLTDHFRAYKDSKRPVVSAYNGKVCYECFKKIKEGINKVFI